MSKAAHHELQNDMWAYIRAAAERTPQDIARERVTREQGSDPPLPPPPEEPPLEDEDEDDGAGDQLVDEEAGEGAKGADRICQHCWVNIHSSISHVLFVYKYVYMFYLSCQKV